MQEMEVLDDDSEEGVGYREVEVREQDRCARQLYSLQAVWSLLHVCMSACLRGIET
jgi:hypothetical protein